MICLSRDPVTPRKARGGYPAWNRLHRQYRRFETRMNSPLFDTAMASHVEHLPSSALHVRPRIEELGGRKSTFPPKLPRVLCGPLRIALDELAPKVATVEDMP